MTDAEFQQIGTQFSRYMETFRPHLGECRNFENFATYCRGLLSEEERKTVEPLALCAGLGVRAFQVFLKAGVWSRPDVRQLYQVRWGRLFAHAPDPDGLGTVGLADETSSCKKGTLTPGVKRQYLGCVGKVENGIVTVHLGAVRGELKTLLDADLFLPKEWSQDRPRCERAGIPAEKKHESKWKLVYWQYLRARQNGVHFAWLTFDEGYGRASTFLYLLHLVDQAYVAEIPVNYRAACRADGPRQEVRELLKASARKGWQRWLQELATGGVVRWKYRTRLVWSRRHAQQLMVAVKVATGEVKYFLSNKVSASGKTLLRVACKRPVVEQLFRASKQEVGLMHYEGRSYEGLLRHLTMSMVVLGFVAEQVAILKKKHPEITMEQICRALKVRVALWFRQQRATSERQHGYNVIRYHQARNATSRASRYKMSRRRAEFYNAL